MSAASFSAPVAGSTYVGLKPNPAKLFVMKDSVAWNKKTVSNGSKTHCMKVWNPIDNKKFETLSYLPPLTDESIAREIDYMMKKGWVPCLEFDAGVKAFVELSSYIVMVSSLDFHDSFEFDDLTSYSRASSSLRFNSTSAQSTAKIGSCASSRFSFTVAHHFDSVKPWYLSLGDTSSSKVGPTNPSLVGPALISSANARSFSFASPAARTTRGNIHTVARKSFFPSTPLPQKTQTFDHTHIKQPRTPNPSFLQSPAMSFFTSKKECHVSKADKCRESFAMFLKFYRRPYDEMTYRSKMRPPLGGLISIVSPQLRRRHMSVSQRF